MRFKSKSEARREPDGPLERASGCRQRCAVHSGWFCVLKVGKWAQALGIVVCVLMSVERGVHDREGQVRARSANLANPVAFLQPNGI